MNGSVIDMHPFLKLPLERAREVVEGVARGDFYQDGGVIRNAKTGRFVAFLRGVKDGGSELGRAASSFASGLMQVGAAASILNLGVSVVGFALLNRKLNQVQDGIRLLDRAMREGFDQVNGRLDDIGAQMVALRLLTVRVHSDLARVEDKLDRVSAQIDLAQFAPLSSSFEQLSEVDARREQPSPAWFIGHADRAQQVRNYCIAMLQRNDVARLSPADPRFVASIAYLDVSALALVLEARTLRAAGETALARRRLESGLAQLRLPATEIVGQLCDRRPSILAARPLVARVGEPALASIARLLEPESVDPMRKLREEWSATVASGPPETLVLLRSLRTEIDAWVERAEAARRTTEIMEMLATLREEYAVCEQYALPPAQWERLADASASDELVLLVSRTVTS